MSTTIERPPLPTRERVPCPEPVTPAVAGPERPDSGRPDSGRLGVSHPRCPYCHDLVLPGRSRPKRACEACMAWHHRSCWTDHGACAACGERRGQRPPASDWRRRLRDGEVLRLRRQGNLSLLLAASPIPALLLGGALAIASRSEVLGVLTGLLVLLGLLGGPVWAWRLHLQRRRLRLEDEPNPAAVAAVALGLFQAGAGLLLFALEVVL